MNKRISDSLFREGALPLGGARVLITGASGFIGRHVVRESRRLGAEVFGLSRTGPQPPGIDYFQCDLGDAPRLRRAILDCRPDMVIHLAAAGVVPGSSQVGDLLRSNVVGLANLLAACLDLSSSPAVVVAGSGFEYASKNRPIRETDPTRPGTPYGVSKLAATMVTSLFSRSVPITVLRVFGVYGPGEGASRIAPFVIDCAKRGFPVRLTAGEQIRDYVHVADIAQAFLCAAAAAPGTGNPRIMNLGSGSGISIRTFVETLAAIIRMQNIEPDLRFGELPYRAGEPMCYCANIDRVQRILGWAPRISLQQGLSEMVEAAI